MHCAGCGQVVRRNLWQCDACKAPLKGGVVFITGISGSAADQQIQAVAKEAGLPGHEHSIEIHDVGALMHEFAREHDPDVQWDRILDADPKTLRYLRALAFERIGATVKSRPQTVHLVDLHLCFRWSAFLTKGFAPYLLESFVPYVRCFINLIEDLSKVQERLAKTSWGKREILELLIWRDEELFLSEIFADVCGRVQCFAVANGEPPQTIERLIWHPEFKKVYLSFPITGIRGDAAAEEEIRGFRDRIRDFLVVFDPYACRDYDETYSRSEMEAIRREVGETTVDRDFRFIDQADAVVVYFPRKVSSKGVDAEMNHARVTGKPIFLYSPEDLGGGPFAVPPSHYRNKTDEYIALLESELGPIKGA